jgi:CheY-like chemotaxis protein
MHCDRNYLSDVPEIILASQSEPPLEGDYTYFEVSDTGCGMEPNTIERIFDPFFTTKFTGRGIGMSAVLGIVCGHKGTLKINSEVGIGTTIRAFFPAKTTADNSSSIRMKDQADMEKWRGSGTVILADDEEIVLKVGKQMFELLGFSVLTASDGLKALELFRQYTDEIVCVFLDLTMPRMDGEEAFREIQLINPDAAVILCSGYTELDATQRFKDCGLAGFIQKPFTIKALQEKLMQVVSADDHP